MNDDPRDELDRALSHGLSSLASGGDNADAVLSGMRPQLRRARTRYRATRLGSAALIVLLAAGGIALLRPHGSASKLKVAANPTTLAPATTTIPHHSHPHVATTTTSLPFRTQTVPAPLPVTTIPAPVVTAPAPPISAEPSDHGPKPVTTTTTVAKTSVDYTYHDVWGKLTVHFDNGTLTLVSDTPASGYTATVERNEPTDIRVQFVGSEGTFLVRVQVSNGQPKESVEE